MLVGYLAIDLGPSRSSVGVVDPEGVVMIRDRIPTPARNVWPAITGLARRVLAANPTDVRPVAIGVTCPGPIDRMTGAMKPPGLPTWHDFPIRRELAELTGLPVAIETSGRGLALAQAWLGPAFRSGHGATLVLGDTADGGLMIHGRLADGATGNLGQFGHIVVEPGGERCVCGASGCLAAYATTGAITASTGRDLRRTPDAIVERTGIMTARAIASLAAMLDVSDVIVGGVVPSVLGERFFDALEVELDQRSRLGHLAELLVHPAGALGPLAAAAAVARTVAPDGRPDDGPDGEADVGPDVGSAGGSDGEHPSTESQRSAAQP